VRILRRMDMRELLEKQPMTKIKALLSIFRPHWFKEEEELDKIPISRKVCYI
jgi:hypothetical protein